MCFVNGDYDWTADVVEKSADVSDGSVCCEECHKKIPDGETYTNIFMQEHEECQACYNGECKCPMDANDDPVCADGDCKCANPSFGETSDYNRCSECDRFLEVIEEVEREEGCRPYERRPDLGVMVEEIGNLMDYDGPQAGKRYFKAAAKRAPELVASGYIKRLWSKLSHVASRS